MPRHVTRRPEGTVTRGTTAPNRLRRVDRWLVATQADRLRIADAPPLVVDLGFGASPVTTVELYERLRHVRPDVEVIGLEIDPRRVEQAVRFLTEGRQAGRHPGLTFAVGGFELPVARPPILIRAFNVLRQYDEDEHVGELCNGAGDRIRLGDSRARSGCGGLGDTGAHRHDPHPDRSCPRACVQACVEKG